MRTHSVSSSLREIAAEKASRSTESAPPDGTACSSPAPTPRGSFLRGRLLPARLLLARGGAGGGVRLPISCGVRRACLVRAAQAQGAAAVGPLAHREAAGLAALVRRPVPGGEVALRV